jgi:hypothetical protein
MNGEVGFGMRSLILKFFLVSITLCGTFALAAEVKELEQTGEIKYLTPPYAFTLHNDAGQEMNIYLGTEPSNLTKQTLQRDVMKPFSDGKSTQYAIEIPTQGRERVKYRLSAGKRYRIFWNVESQRWDIETLGQ